MGGERFQRVSGGSIGREEGEGGKERIKCGERGREKERGRGRGSLKYRSGVEAVPLSSDT